MKAIKLLVTLLFGILIALFIVVLAMYYDYIEVRGLFGGVSSWISLRSLIDFVEVPLVLSLVNMVLLLFYRFQERKLGAWAMFISFFALLLLPLVVPRGFCLLRNVLERGTYLPSVGPIIEGRTICVGYLLFSELIAILFSVVITLLGFLTIPLLTIVDRARNPKNNL